MDIEDSGFGTGLDYDRIDELSEAEKHRLYAWYSETHGGSSSDLRLVAFVPFLAEHLPGALKRWRRFAETAGTHGGISQGMVALLFLHFYAVAGNADGVRYECIAARAWGARRDEVLDAINLAFVNGGPFGMNVAADAIQDLLADWATADDSTTSAWPSHVAVSGSPPAPLPEALDARVVMAHRDRVHSALRALPNAAAPLFLIHLGVGRANEAVCRHATSEAMRLGIPRNMFEAAALWGVPYGGEPGLMLASEAVARLAEIGAGG